MKLGSIFHSGVALFLDRIMICVSWGSLSRACQIIIPFLACSSVVVLFPAWQALVVISPKWITELVVFCPGNGVGRWRSKHCTVPVSSLLGSSQTSLRATGSARPIRVRHPNERQGTIQRWCDISFKPIYSLKSGISRYVGVSFVLSFSTRIGGKPLILHPLKKRWSKWWITFLFCNCMGLIHAVEPQDYNNLITCCELSLSHCLYQ
jgi:hypothetical protein